MGGADRLLAERHHRLYCIPVSDVDYIEAYGNYVRIHVGDCEYLRRDTLARLTHELQGAGFQRVRRSTLLNLRRVAFAERLRDGALAFTLGTGARLISRTRFRLTRSFPVEVRRGVHPHGAAQQECDSAQEASNCVQISR